MLYAIVNLLLPIAVVLFLGAFGKRKGWLTAEGMDVFKSVIGNILLPLILFNAMFTAEYSVSAIITILIVFAGMCVSLAIGFFLKRLFPSFGKYLPFMISTCESGMLGYPLIAMLFGDDGTRSFAMADLPHTVFFFAVALTLLQITDGLRPSAPAIVKNIFTALPFDGMLLGMALGLLGVDTLLQKTPVWGTYTTLISFVTAPTTVLVLLFLGYSLSLKKETLRPVVVTSLLRLAVMGAVAALVSFIVFCLVPFSKPLLFSILLVFLLPPSFSVPVFSRLTGSEEYVSTTISFSTILTLLVFAVMAVFAYAG